jgi:uncharacterized membrane protein
VNTQAPAKPELSSSEYVTAVSHFFRGEMNRANVWRTRLDTTTNWAIITTAAFLSFGFGSKEIPHFVFILATIFVLFFLIIESRRYKYFDLWRWRVALVEENFFATVFSPSKKPLHENWQEVLSWDLQHPRFKINFAEAFGRRLRRNYGWIFSVLAISWITKVSIHPTPVENFSKILQRADIFHLVPGWIVLAVGIIFNGTLLVIAIATLKEREEEVRISPAKKSKLKLTNI